MMFEDTITIIDIIIVFCYTIAFILLDIRIKKIEKQLDTLQNINKVKEKKQNE